jgi:fructose-1,6-bisphosphatase I
MDITPETIHQRVPVMFGSKTEVDRIGAYHRDYVDGKDEAKFNSPLFSTRSLFRTQ